MNVQEEIASLQQRLKAAESARDACGARGRTEQYLQAYCDVEALGKLLDERLRAGAEAHQ